MKRCQNCEFLSLFLTNSIKYVKDLNKYIKLLCKMKLWDKLEKDEFVGKCSAKKVVLENFIKFTGKTFVGVSFLIKFQASGLYLY